jgi:alpha-tubulin suppressor-like RCC1 family protein
VYRDSEGYPFQPTPISIKLISGNKIIEVSCGDAHTLALTKDGKIFSFGGIKIKNKSKKLKNL